MILPIGTVTVSLPLKKSQELSIRDCLVRDFLRGYFVTWYCVPAHYSCVPHMRIGKIVVFSSKCTPRQLANSARWSEYTLVNWEHGLSDMSGVF